jgi:hypothetical protein
MLFIYQIKVGLCLIAFYLLWKLLLSRETFHRFNRVALLTAMALAMVLPWVRLSLDVAAPVAQQMVVLEDLIVTPNGQVAASQASLSGTGIATVPAGSHAEPSAATAVFDLQGRRVSGTTKGLTIKNGRKMITK